MGGKIIADKRQYPVNQTVRLYAGVPLNTSTENYENPCIRR